MTRYRALMLRVAAAALICLTLVSAASAQEAALTAQEIIDRAVLRAEEQQEAQADLAFQAFVEAATENLGGDGEVKKTERETYHQYPLEGVVFEELVAKEGEPLNEEDARSERERRDEFVQKVRERRAKGEDPLEEDENRIEFNQEFISRYEFSVVGEEEVNGHATWVLDFEPRDGELPNRRRIDTALNNSTGRVWVTQDDYGLARVEFEMAKSVKFWGGILGTLRNTVGQLEFTRVAERVWMPTTIDIRLDLRILFRSIRRRIVREWVEYAPIRATED